MRPRTAARHRPAEGADPRVGDVRGLRPAGLKRTPHFMAHPPAADDLGGRSASLALPPDALVLLVGIAGSGKSTFARRHFAPTQVLSSDALRAMITDNPHAQGATDDAFDLLHRILAMRLRRGRLTLVATGASPCAHGAAQMASPMAPSRNARIRWRVRASLGRRGRLARAWGAVRPVVRRR